MMLGRKHAHARMHTIRTCIWARTFSHKACMQHARKQATTHKCIDGDAREHACAHKETHAHTSTRKLKKCIGTSAHTYMRTQEENTGAHTRTHTDTHTHTHAHTRTRAHTIKRTHTHTRTHAHAHCAHASCDVVCVRSKHKHPTARNSAILNWTTHDTRMHACASAQAQDCTHTRRLSGAMW